MRGGCEETGIVPRVHTCGLSNVRMPSLRLGLSQLAESSGMCDGSLKLSLSEPTPPVPTERCLEQEVFCELFQLYLASA